jgi:DNA repair exonuclease SbcCD ATPase subunit
MEPTRTSSSEGVGAEADELTALRASIERVNAENRELRAALVQAHEEIQEREREHGEQVTRLQAEIRRKTASLGNLRSVLVRERRLNAWLRNSLPGRIVRRLRGARGGP